MQTATGGTSNLLSVPMQSSSGHQRSSSFGSTTSASQSTPFGSSDAPSDLGDPNIDLRKLVDTPNDEAQTADNPFSFTPKQMAKLHDPKHLNVLRAMGGLTGLVYGLWTDLRKGLSADEDKIPGRRTLQDVLHHVETQKKEDKKHDFSRQAQEGEEDAIADEPEGKGKEPEVVGTGLTHKATKRSISIARTQSTSASKGFSDRKRIFSENRIPARKPKNIFQLMWMALHDKILVTSSS